MEWLTILPIACTETFTLYWFSHVVIFILISCHHLFSSPIHLLYTRRPSTEMPDKLISPRANHCNQVNGWLNGVSQLQANRWNSGRQALKWLTLEKWRHSCSKCQLPTVFIPPHEFPMAIACMFQLCKHSALTHSYSFLSRIKAIGIIFLVCTVCQSPLKLWLT